MKQILAPIVAAEEVLPRFHLLWIQAPEIASEAEPGQFVMVRCGDADDPLLRRPFSLHRVKGSQIAVFFNEVSSFNRLGAGTSKLAEYRKDDCLDLIGPLGRGFSVKSETGNLVLICGGIGIASLVFLADRAIAEGKSVTLLAGAASKDNLYPCERLASEVHTIKITEDGSMGQKGLVTEFLAQEALDDPSTQIFACGPNRMYKAMARDDRFANKPVQVSMEVMMGCGVGACYGCTIKTKGGPKRVCVDGPVFDLNDILWGEIVDPY